MRHTEYWKPRADINRFRNIEPLNPIVAFNLKYTLQPMHFHA